MSACASPCEGGRRQAILACVPRLDRFAWHMQRVARMLVHTGVDARVETAAAGRVEVCVSLTFDGVPLVGSFDLAQWCALQFDGGDRLAFGEIDPAYLLPLIEYRATAKLRQIGDLPVSAWRALELRCPSTSGLRLRLETGPGWPPLWLSGWPTARYPRRAPAMPWRASLDSVPMPLSLVVGRSRVTRGLMRRVARGDVLLVQCPEWRMQVAHRTLGVFSVSGQEWKMEAFKMDVFKEILRREHAAMARDASSPVELAMLDDLPVEAEFLLASRTLSLGELRALHTGAVFTLARHSVPGAENTAACREPDPRAPAGMQSAACPGEPTPAGEGASAQGYLVEVRINGLIVGQGELVALGDQLAVQIVRLNGEA
jgi:flagellar motor switch/type III secretory pathway protein FliN